jgi:MinD-like ATPase involved in chromosome partitioning or flagellar assembly
MVKDCDSGMPYVMSSPNSEATKALQNIAQLCKEYVGEKATRMVDVQSAQRQL